MATLDTSCTQRFQSDADRSCLRLISHSDLAHRSRSGSLQRWAGTWDAGLMWSIGSFTILVALRWGATPCARAGESQVH